MLNPRQSIEYHNRKFKFVFAGFEPSGNFTFHLNSPPNEFAFSDRYSQCLIQITRAHLSNRGDTVNHGLDSEFTDQATGGFEVPCITGVMLKTDIKSNNQALMLSDGIVQEETGIFCILNSKYGSAGVDGAFGGVASNCAALVKRGGAAAGDGGKGANDNLHLVNAWEYLDQRPIEDAGVLCGNPFGKEFSVSLIDPEGGQTPVKLTSQANFNQAASNGSCLNFEMEILMLPNPTPSDK